MLTLIYLVASGAYEYTRTSPNPPPILLCSDACGVVVLTGLYTDSTSPFKDPNFRLKAGDRVISTNVTTHLTGQMKASDINSCAGGPAQGVLAHYRVFPTYAVVKVPDYLTDEEASCLPVAAMTAWSGLNCMRPKGETIGPGETVLCQGTGGVSIAGLQQAAAAGARVIVTSSSDAKLARAVELGATDTINYKTRPDWEAAVLEMTSGEGADVIFEMGGPQTLSQSFKCVKFGGLISCIGYLSGKEDTSGDGAHTNWAAILRNVTLKGIFNGPRDELEYLVRFYDDKKIRPIVDRVFTFEQGRDAIEHLLGASHFGKVVIRVQQ